LPISLGELEKFYTLTPADLDFYAQTYYRWKHKFGFTKSPKRVFSRKERPLIVNDAVKVGVRNACRQHRIGVVGLHAWAQQVGRKIRDGKSKNGKQEYSLLGPLLACQ
jgi:hypothetical protein